MKLGFLTAALPNKSLGDLAKWGNEKGFKMIEVACWPASYEQRRYAGTQHIDMDKLSGEKVAEIKELLKNNNLEISSLAYYPNPLTPDLEAREFCINHLKKVITGASKLGVPVVGTFVGRDKDMNVDDSLAEYKRVFDPIVKFAADHGVKLAIENCPMLWKDRWPGGHNLAYSPEVWERMFELIQSDYIGLNLDPSHLVWQQIDYVKAVYDFKQKIYHTHAKDTKMLPEKFARCGIYGFGFYLDKIAGLGDIDWKRYLGALYEVGYTGVVSVEHEDRAWEKDEQNIMDGINLARKLLANYFID
jgi:Sugar phosphate isomerases/epimerases